MAVALTSIPFLADSFTGADGTLLTAHAPELGGAWSLQPGSTGVMGINNNRTFNTSGAPTFINAATPASADYEIAAQMIPLSVVHNTSWGIMGRSFTTNLTGYAAFLYGFSGNFSILLSLYNNSSYANLSTVAPPGGQPTLGTSHELKLRMSGDKISVFYDGLLAIPPVTSATITPAGKAGLFGNTTTTTTGVVVDSVVASAIVRPPIQATARQAVRRAAYY